MMKKRIDPYERRMVSVEHELDGGEYDLDRLTDLFAGKANARIVVTDGSYDGPYATMAWDEPEPEETYQKRVKDHERYRSRLAERIEKKIAKAREKQAKEALRQSAFSKLTEDERKALGL